MIAEMYGGAGGPENIMGAEKRLEGAAAPSSPTFTPMIGRLCEKVLLVCA